ncbi:trypsin-like peptidase domain-containing protein [Streptomyces sp. NPDC030392]|uniref:S1C family serine protease n=1 Tax=Streptomyces sp. NPDC030392 TaxID=3155468 RepID=UPI0033FA9207
MTDRSATPQGTTGEPHPYAGAPAASAHPAAPADTTPLADTAALAGPVGALCPPPPAYPPVPPPSAATGEAPPRRRARRPALLIAAAALVAAAVGGGTGALAQHLAADAPAAAPAAATGTAIGQRSAAGTVAAAAATVAPSIVEIKAVTGQDTGSGQSTGSGVVITADGEVVTNHHVVAGASEVRVRLADGTAYTADVVGSDPGKDLALLRLRGAKGLKAAPLGDSSRLRVGDQVVAIGSPAGLTGTVTSGIVSALDRDVTVGGDGGRGGPYGGQGFGDGTGASKTTYKAIQTDASLNPGNSGGALIDLRGRVVGVNSAMYAPSTGSGAGSVGLGFAIPVNTLKAALDSLRGS